MFGYKDIFMYMMKSLLLVSFMVVFSAGCASHTSDKAEQYTTSDEPLESSETASESDIICTYEKKLGKLIKEKTCYTKRQRDIIKQATEEMKVERQSQRTIGNDTSTR